METTMPDRTIIQSLADAVEPVRVGGKAAALGDLIRAGFDVPDGVVVPAKATERRSPEMIAADIVALLGDGPFAVRSSAVGEDGGGASYAGQYDTVLGARGVDEVSAAIERCVASARSARVLAYRSERGLDGPAPMAVIVQHMVAADAAGVAFTANPVTGARDEVLVSSVKGLGERLVSGEVDPDEWAVNDGEARCLHDREGSIVADQAVAVARLAREVDEHLGVASDVEWAISNGEVHLLQARPITTLAGGSGDSPEWESPGAGYWWADTAHFSRPATPLTVSVYLPRIQPAINGSAQRFGFVPDRIAMDLVGHRLYACVVPPGGRHGPPPPRPVLWLLSRLLPPMRRKRRVAEEAFNTDLPLRDIEWWWNQGRSETFNRLRSLEAVDRSALSDAELIEHARDVADYFEHGQNAHFRLFPAHVLGVAELMMFCDEVLGWNGSEGCALMAGHSPMSSEPGRRLAELTQMAAEIPAVRDALHGDDPLAALDADAAFAAAFDEYLDEYGVRAMSYDAADPTFGDDPSVIIRTIKGQLDSGYDPAAVEQSIRDQRDTAAARAREQLADRPADRERFEQLLQRAEAAFGVREDNEFPTVSAAIGLLRLVALEIGERLSERGLIDEATDVFMLEFDAALEALSERSEMRETVQQHRHEIQQSLATPPPASFGEQHDPPDMSVLPGALRRFNEAMVWFIGNDVDAPPVEGDGLRGVGASSGTYTGTARIVRDESEFDKLEPGDVLVCPITSPVWSVLFSQVGALVTDHGGLLSHSAIIAREYGIPAVLATQTATAELRDGQRVTVDGAAGVVTPA